MAISAAPGNLPARPSPTSRTPAPFSTNPISASMRRTSSFAPPVERSVERGGRGGDGDGTSARFARRSISWGPTCKAQISGRCTSAVELRPSAPSATPAPKIRPWRCDLVEHQLAHLGLIFRRSRSSPRASTFQNAAAAGPKRRSGSTPSSFCIGKVQPFVRFQLGRRLRAK
jgi:hypothetical protein